MQMTGPYPSRNFRYNVFYINACILADIQEPCTGMQLLRLLDNCSNSDEVNCFMRKVIFEYKNG